MCALLLLCALLQARPFGAIRTKRIAGWPFSRPVSNVTNSSRRSICMVSANQAQTHDKDLGELFQHCLANAASTKIVAPALQDFYGKLPKYATAGVVPALQGTGKKFKLRHVAMLGKEDGGGHCIAHHAGGALGFAASGAILGLIAGAANSGAIPGPTGTVVSVILGSTLGGIVGYLSNPGKPLPMRCGGVSLAVYSLGDIEVAADEEFVFSSQKEAPDAQDEHDGGATWTTRKGTVASRFIIFGKHFVFASTHATEGVRSGGKDPDAYCDIVVDTQAFKKGIKKERKRMEDFRGALRVISNLRTLNKATDESAAVLWGGDFNARSVDARGYPIFPRLARVPSVDEPHEDVEKMDSERELAKLREAKDFIGADPSGPDGWRTPLALFSKESAAGDLVEAEGLKCPTYRKEKQPTSEEAVFSCEEDGRLLTYSPKRPPSWTDRIFHSRTGPDTPIPWLQCGPTHRVLHDSDHDGVLVVCSVES